MEYFVGYYFVMLEYLVSPGFYTFMASEEAKVTENLDDPASTRQI